MRRYDLRGAPRVPLTADDRACLLTMYRTRRRFFWIAFSLLTVFAWIETGPVHVAGGDAAAVRRTTFLNRDRNRPWYWVEHWPLSLNRLLLEKAFVYSLLFVPGAAVYRRRIGALWNDLQGGGKAHLQHTITGKQHFESTGQYFLLLDDPDCLHAEVDREAYDRARIGGTIFSYLAPRSGYAFNLRGRYEVL